MGRSPHHALRFVGGASAVFAGLGLWYNATTLFTRYPPDPSTPYFAPAFYTMSAICLTGYLLLLLVGVQFLRLNSSHLRLFIGLMIFEVLYFFVASFWWLTPGIGMSIAAASGVALGGLTFQFLVLFPLWGPLLARWAKNGIAMPNGEVDLPYFPAEWINRPSDWMWAAVNFVVMLAVTSMLVSLAWRQLTGALAPSGLVLLASLLLAGANGLLSVRGRRKRRRKEIAERHAQRLRAGLCPRCEYSLTGLTHDRCPECGCATKLGKGGLHDGTVT